MVKVACQRLASEQCDELAQGAAVRRSTLGSGRDWRPVLRGLPFVLSGKRRDAMVEPGCICAAGVRHWQPRSQQVLRPELWRRGPVRLQDLADYRAGQDPVAGRYV